MDHSDRNEPREMTYRETEEWLARTTGGHGTKVYSDTNVEEVKRLNRESQSRQ